MILKWEDKERLDKIREGIGPDSVLADILCKIIDYIEAHGKW